MQDLNYKLNWRWGLVAGYLAFFSFALVYNATCSKHFIDFCGIGLFFAAIIPAVFIEWLPFVGDIIGENLTAFIFINVCFWYFIGWLIDKSAKNKTI